MNAKAQTVNTGYGSVAPLRNVVEAYSVAMQLIGRPEGVDGLGLFYGHSGYGKSRASMFIQNKCGALYLEVFDFWTKKTFCEKLLAEIGVAKPKSTIAGMMDQALLHLQDDPNRLLIVDEADKLVDKGMIELVRDLYKGARIPVLLVGEELLPDKLARYERCRNRVSAFGLAQPSDLDDARKLARIYHPQVAMADDLLDEARRKADGKASYIVATLSKVAEAARAAGAKEMTLDNYAGPFFTGDAPRRGKL